MLQCTSLTDVFDPVAASTSFVVFVAVIAASILVITAQTKLVRQIKEKENKCKLV